MKKLLCGDYTQYTPAGKALFVKQGRYGKIPHPGDVVYFFSKALDRVAHVGIVIAVSNIGLSFRIKTIEGNTTAGDSFSRNGGCVAFKTYTFEQYEVGNGNHIDGFGTPFFGRDTCDVETFVNTAVNEVGYIEKASNKDLDSKTGNPGKANYTKYGLWYGGNGLFWCQQYVSWVAHMACKAYQKKKNRNTWVKEGEDWYYKNTSGECVKGKWKNINGRWYVFDESGKAIKGWFSSEGTWYYMAGDYAMISGQWLEDNSDYFYFDSSGAMAKNAIIKMKNGKLCFVDGNGVYIPDATVSSEDEEKYPTILEGE